MRKGRKKGQEFRRENISRAVDKRNAGMGKKVEERKDDMGKIRIMNGESQEKGQELEKYIKNRVGMEKGGRGKR